MQEMTEHIQHPHADDAQILTVAFARLLVDREHYQRSAIPTHVAHLAMDFDPATAELLTVNIRVDGVIALIDGQHRMLAAAERGYTEWPAYAWTGLTIPEEAALFLRKNHDRRHHSALGRWKAELTAGDPLVHALQRIVTECGYEITLSRASKATNPRSLTSPEMIRRIARGRRDQHVVPDPERVRQVLSFLAHTWPDDPNGVTEYVLGGTALFLRKYGGALDLNKAARRLATTPLSTLARQSALLRDVDRMDRISAYCRALQQAHDKGLKAGRLEPVAPIDTLAQAEGLKE